MARKSISRPKQQECKFAENANNKRKSGKVTPPQWALYWYKGKNCKQVGHMTRECRIPTATRINKLTTYQHSFFERQAENKRKLKYTSRDNQKPTTSEQEAKYWQSLRLQERGEEKKEILRRYMQKGFPIFLAYVTTKEVEDKSEKKRLEDVPIVRDFPEVFPEDFYGVLPSDLRTSGDQIDLVPGAAPNDKNNGEENHYPLPELIIYLIKLKGFSSVLTSSVLLEKSDLQGQGLSPIEGSRKEDIRRDCLQNSLQLLQINFKLCRLNEQEHKEHLKQILELLKKEELYAKFSKCEFWIPKVQFLGHVIGSEGILCGTSKRLNPIKDGTSHLSHQQEILSIFRNEDFIAYCDTSKKGLGAVLIQGEKILNAQTEARKPENIKSEDVGGMSIENAKFPES
ncbi:hypothetical protein Tco_0974742 [Tanacetum coccineum]|uniref:Reverse transcriptase domain-containing protein n=1 Tax=Tanacetum coccineum TaxID=301880 RepID=A0ABQ5ECH0_9ASTR